MLRSAWALRAALALPRGSYELRCPARHCRGAMSALVADAAVRLDPSGKSLRLLRMLRLLKLVRVVKASRLASRWVDHVAISFASRRAGLEPAACWLLLPRFSRRL